MQIRINEIPGAVKPLKTVSVHDPAKVAIRTMLDSNVSAVALVDPEKGPSIVANFVRPSLLPLSFCRSVAMSFCRSVIL